MGLYTFDLDDITDDDNKVYLYYGEMTETYCQINSKSFVGIHTKENDYNIEFDFENDNLSNIIGFNCIDIFQSEEMLNKIEYSHLPRIIDKIYDLLKIGGFFRLSLPDYRNEILKNRVLGMRHIG